MASIRESREVVQCYALTAASNITKYRDMDISAYRNFSRNNTKVINARVVANFNLVCVVNRGPFTYPYIVPKRFEVH